MVSSRNKPRVIITRPRDFQTSPDEFSRKIEELGYEPVVMPVLKYEIRRTPEIKAAILKCTEPGFDWYVFSSPASVKIFKQLLSEQSASVHLRKVAVQGSGTAKVLESEFKIVPTLCPSEYTSEALAAALESVVKRGESVLIPCSSESRNVVYEDLLSSDVSVTRLFTYGVRSIKTDLTDEEARELSCNQKDTILFFSPSAVNSLCAYFPAFQPPSEIAVQVVSVGPITGRAAKRAGFRHVMEAKEHSEIGVLKALKEMLYEKSIVAS